MKYIKPPVFYSINESKEESTVTVDTNGNKIWYNSDGQVHRLDGPAIEYTNGDSVWYLNDQIHRLNGPAIIGQHGKQWVDYGTRHRLDGPAIEWSDGTKEWWINGKKVTKEEVDRAYAEELGIDPGDLDILNLLTESKDDESTMSIDSGNKYWRNSKGQLHRTDGPAIEYKNGNKSWFVNGNSHRLDGPAVELIDGTKQWRVNGQRHRLDGPAVEDSNGDKQWWVNGQRHRLDGPAIEYSYGGKEWWVNGKRHRLDGPAIETPNVYRSWFINGVPTTEDKVNRAYAEELGIDPEDLDILNLLTESTNSVGKGSVLLVKGRPNESGSANLYATTIDGIVEIKTGVQMVFINPSVYRVKYKEDGRFYGSKIDYRSEAGLKGVFNMRGTGQPSLVLNHNKTPFHWETLKHSDIGAALRSLGNRLFSVNIDFS